MFMANSEGWHGFVPELLPAALAHAVGFWSSLLMQLRVGGMERRHPFRNLGLGIVEPSRVWCQQVKATSVSPGGFTDFPWNSSRGLVNLERKLGRII